MNDFEKIRFFFIKNYRKILGAIFGFFMALFWVKYGFWKMLGIFFSTFVFSIIFELMPKNIKIKDIIIKILNKGEDY